VVGRDDARGDRVDGLVRGGHGAAGHQLLDDVAGLHAHALRQLANRDALLHFDDLLLFGHLGDLRLLPLLGGLLLLAADGDRDTATHEITDVLLADLGALFVGGLALAAALLLLALGDVDELFAVAELVRHHLELANLADRLLARSDREVLVRARRGRHAAHRNQRALNDDGLGRGRPANFTDALNRRATGPHRHARPRSRGPRARDDARRDHRRWSRNRSARRRAARRRSSSSRRRRRRGDR